jgi:hypothetical protein
MARCARRLIPVVLGAAIALPLVLTTAMPAASAACAGLTGNLITGTVSGLDGRDVNVSIGFDVESTTGQVINVSDGCAKTGGYSAPVKELNHYVSGEGQARGSRMYDSSGAYKGLTTRGFSLTGLPSNAKYVWIEVYARRYSGSPCTTCMGPADLHKYGYAMRRRVPVNTRGVNIRLPMTCSSAWGGSAGRITGSVRNSAGSPVTPSHVYAWSELPDNSTALTGWGSGSISGGSYSISALASRQSYTMWLYVGTKVYKRTHIGVGACGGTVANWTV